jgi:hypothetical protein
MAAKQPREKSIVKKILALAGMAIALLCGLPQPDADAAGNHVAVRSAPAVARAPVVTRSVGVVAGRPAVVHRSHRHVRSGVYITPVVVGSSCAWMRVKAVNTGSRYWWHRYRECRGWE